MSTAEADTSYVDAIQQQDPARRLQFLNSPEQFDELPYMSDEAKGMAKGLIQATYGAGYDMEEVPDHGALKKREPNLGFVQRDPETLQAMMPYYLRLAAEVAGLTPEQLGDATTRAAGIDGVTDDPVVKRKFRNSMLMCLKVADRNDDVWFKRLQATIPGFLTPEQASVIGNPRSTAWDAEDSLVLRYTQAFLDGAVTDELFAEVSVAWNPQILYQHSLWIGMYHTISLVDLLNTTDAARSGLVA